MLPVTEKKKVQIVHYKVLLTYASNGLIRQSVLSSLLSERWFQINYYRTQIIFFFGGADILYNYLVNSKLFNVSDQVITLLTSTFCNSSILKGSSENFMAKIRYF